MRPAFWIYVGSDPGHNHRLLVLRFIDTRWKFKHFKDRSLYCGYLLD
ncbi:hypothetical protein Plhal304r1_c073g0161021 [Plasmopara halstedii]